MKKLTKNRSYIIFPALLLVFALILFAAPAAHALAAEDNPSDPTAPHEPLFVPVSSKIYWQDNAEYRGTAGPAIDGQSTNEIGYSITIAGINTFFEIKSITVSYTCRNYSGNTVQRTNDGIIKKDGKYYYGISETVIEKDKIKIKIATSDPGMGYAFKNFSCNIEFETIEIYFVFDSEIELISGETTAQVIKNQKLAQLPMLAAAPEDKYFVGWNTQPDGRGESFKVGETVVTQDMTLYAIWQPEIKKINFAPNGGKIDVGEQQIGVVMGTSWSAVAKPTVRRDGYVFAGWYTAPVGGQLLAGTVEDNITAYARWEPETVPAVPTVYVLMIVAGVVMLLLFIVIAHPRK